MSSIKGHWPLGGMQSRVFVVQGTKTKPPTMNRRSARRLREQESLISSLSVNRLIHPRSRSAQTIRRNALGSMQRSGALSYPARERPTNCPLPDSMALRKTGSVYPVPNAEATFGQKARATAAWRNEGFPPPPAPTGYKKVLYQEGKLSSRLKLDLSRLRFNKTHVRRLPLNRWPIRPDGKKQWPSYPTTDEVMLGGPDIIRGNYITYADRNVSRRNLDLNDPRILKNILGIRADVEVPVRYLVFFEYRWNFLILTPPKKFPKPFKKFLIGLWQTQRFNLWLRRPVHLVAFVRSLT